MRVSSRFSRYTEPISPAPPKQRRNNDVPDHTDVRPRSNDGSSSGNNTGAPENTELPPGMEAFSSPSKRTVQMMRVLYDEVLDAVPDISEEELRAIYDMGNEEFRRFVQRGFNTAFERYNVTTNSHLQVEADLSEPAAVRIYSRGADSRTQHAISIPPPLPAPSNPQPAAAPPTRVPGGKSLLHAGHPAGANTTAARKREVEGPGEGTPLAAKRTRSEDAAHSAVTPQLAVSAAAASAAAASAGQEDGCGADGRSSEKRPTPAAIAAAVKIFGSPPEFNFFASPEGLPSAGNNHNPYPSPTQFGIRRSPQGAPGDGDEDHESGGGGSVRLL